MSAPPCLIYGAYGFTGTLIAREAVRRGLRPLLAGRDRQRLSILAAELELPHLTLDLADAAGLDNALDTVRAVLHCAGPFIRTSRPMVEACLRTGRHYLDITGEIGVFESIFRQHDRARTAGVVLLPGTGLDVVPTDCLASHLHRRLPTATHLELALASERGSASRGTLVTMVEALPHVGAERIDGKLVSRPPAFATREVGFSHRPLTAMSIPWGDLATAYRTTGIPNIRVYMAASPRLVRRLRRLAPWFPILGHSAIKKSLQWWIRRTVTGPPEVVRQAARSNFWGRVEDAAGNSASATLETPEGYRLTAMTAVECLVRVLGEEPDPGAWTPASAFSADFIKSFAEVNASW